MGNAEYMGTALIKKMFRFKRDKNKTFRPKKGFGAGTKLNDLHKYAKATLGSGNLREAVILPEGEDVNEWLAVNTVDFFNQINLLFSSVVEFCTDETCPVMNVGPKYEYMWADGKKVKKPVRVSASDYVDLLMAWVQDTLDDDSIFPSRVDVPFPRNFHNVIKTIFKRLFRVYAHLYHAHFDRILSLGEEAHLNTCFKHFYYFVDEFSLISSRELAPLQELIDNLVSRDEARLGDDDAGSSAAASS